MAGPNEQNDIPKSMRAWTYSTVRDGLERAIQLVEEPFPAEWRQRKPGWELVEVHSIALNPADYKIPETPWLSWLLTPKPATPCLDFAGTAVGGPLGQKRVFGRLDHPYQHGSLAQYVLAKSDGIAEMPHGLSFEDGAALGTGAVSAYQSIVPFVKQGAATRVFINGGSGGVGTFAIQIAKLLGCFVVASCSSRNVELCKSMGADEVLDYTSLEDGNVGLELGRRTHDGSLKEFDLVVDFVGHDILLHRKSEGFLREDGLFVLLAAMDSNLAGIRSMLSSWLLPTALGGVRRKWKYVLASNDAKAIDQIRDWVATGKLKPVIDQTFAFEEAPRAFTKLRTGRARGRVVVTDIAK